MINDLYAIYSIHFADGTLHPYRRNERRARCARCGKLIEAGEGHKFRKARFADMRSGYWCADCVGVLLACVTRWAWNGVVAQLYTANDDTPQPIDGKLLADAWRAGGYVELGLTLDSMK